MSVEVRGWRYGLGLTAQNNHKNICGVSNHSCEYERYNSSYPEIGRNIHSLRFCRILHLECHGRLRFEVSCGNDIPDLGLLL